MTSPAPIWIQHVELCGLHGHQSISQPLREGLNILHGKNGSGKTTFLHVLANLLNRDISRFCQLRFDRICVKTNLGSTVELHQLSDVAGETKIDVLIDGDGMGTVNGSGISSALDQVLRDRLGRRPVYLPAFRSILEGKFSANRAGVAYHNSEEQEQAQEISQREFQEVRRREPEARSSTYRDREWAEAVAEKTIICRRWFGNFVPVVRYPSIADVQDQVRHELQRAFFALSETDQRALSNVFVRVLEAVLATPVPHPQEDINAIVEEISTELANLNRRKPSVPDAYSNLAGLLTRNSSQISTTAANIYGVLRIYKEALSERAETQEKVFTTIDVFLSSVNRFLEGKQLVLPSNPRSSRPVIVELPNGRQSGLSVLSSGERHVLTLLFSATHMSPDEGVVLLDEPELSLHVDWQRIVLGELIKQAGNRQIVACTHAPEIAAEHHENLFELKTTEWRRSTSSAGHQDGPEDPNEEGE